MVAKRKIPILLLCLLLLAAGGLSLYFSLRNTDLIVTPSSHTQVEILSANTKKLGSDTLRFALYDSESQTYQLCFRVGDTSSNLFFSGDEEPPVITLDGTPVPEFSFVNHHRLFFSYVSILLYDQPQHGPLVIQFKGDSVKIDA